MSKLEMVELELVEPRYIRIRFLGKMEDTDMTALMDAMLDCVEGEPYFLLEADVRNVKNVSAEARRIAAQRFMQLPDRAIAMIGGGFAQKMFAKLVLTAVSMLGKNPRNASAFFDNVDAARAWLQEQAENYRRVGDQEE